MAAPFHPLITPFAGLARAVNSRISLGVGYALAALLTAASVAPSRSPG